MALANKHAAVAFRGAREETLLRSCWISKLGYPLVMWQQHVRTAATLLEPWPRLGRRPLHLKESVLTLEPVIRSAPRIGLFNITLPSMTVSDSAGVGGRQDLRLEVPVLVRFDSVGGGVAAVGAMDGWIDAGYRRVRCAKRLHKCGHKSLAGPGVSTGVARWLSYLFPQQRLCKFFGEQAVEDYGGRTNLR
jgi:hypothetical protein